MCQRHAHHRSSWERRSKHADIQSAGHKTAFGSSPGPVAPSVLINAKKTDPVKLWQFRDKHGEQGNCVDDEVDSVIFGIETGEEVQNNRGDGKKLSRGGELNPVVHLFPVGQQSGLALVRGLKWRPFDRVEEDIHAHVVDEVGKGPNNRHADKGYAEQYDV